MPDVPLLVIPHELLASISVVNALYLDFFDWLFGHFVFDLALVMETEICLFGPTGVIDQLCLRDFCGCILEAEAGTHKALAIGYLRLKSPPLALRLLEHLRGSRRIKAEILLYLVESLCY